ncbi:alpha-glucosidase 2 isoform X1 [Selaginella moellendorffii]|uniref:alpha-glucosidase 2 isoform X1 n=2 Tax=Selaginella moellendorffii TaxID=88036 RepID=UPI000D1C5E49|nr:alpha-glucosidase 2 isoform X1 [Selaginella moellendorffii]XP_024535408.1 alpha-glucosidase 2 isoform X1 [Selaginella moellendorffii]|eukprot:XP_024535407.1 alpha-glucosidase 2 isoform X1 [Selaginella moellendorffii]
MKERRVTNRGAPAAPAAAAAAAASRRRKKPAFDPSGGFFSGVRIGAVAAFAIFVLTAITLVVLLSALYPRETPRSITPVALPKIMDLPQFQGEHKERLYWGTYRPHLYLGIRSRTPKSLLAGLMWLGIKDGYYALRHTCEDSDGLKRYGWVRHDGISYGRQVILDQNMNITTFFSKSWNDGSGYGGDWSVRVNLHDSSEISRLPNGESSLYFYIAEEEGSQIRISRNDASGLAASGHRHDIGHWQIHISAENNTFFHYAGFRTGNMHNITQLVQNSLIVQERKLQLPDTYEKSSNIVVFQVLGRNHLQLDVTFLAGVDEKKFSVQSRLERLSGIRLDETLKVQEQSFDKRFENAYKLDNKELSSFGATNAVEIGKAALSNLLGGISYFYGQSLISIPSKEQKHHRESFWKYWPAALYSAVPCRSFFPRGFLWDEGFHQIIISRWDRNLTYDIVGHWLDLLNVDGWIPREQILGEEARVRVPDEYILQHTDNANPPTLFLPLHGLKTCYLYCDFFLCPAADIALASLESGKENNAERAFLEKTFPRLQAWFGWFNRTQAGTFPGTYYWHGRSITDKELNAKSLSSGLDDYPRASHPSADERHVDLRCWMALAAKSMVMIAKIIGAPHEEYEAMSQVLSDFDVLNQLHYDRKRGRYYDYGNHTEKVKLEWDNFFDPRTGQVQQVLRRVVSGRPKLQLVPQFGYVSLFPFIVKLIPADSQILEAHLNLIQSEKLLWTSYGLRSLATTSSIYNRRNTEHDAPYWRGPVWINMNYLVLSSLHYYSQEPGPYKDAAASVYKQLRANLISNVARRYNEVGYIFEQYDHTKEGEGKGARPFTGWSSLILLIMAEQYQR